MSPPEEHVGGTAYGSRPGVCNDCGYRIRPDREEFTSVGGYDFVHEECVTND
jgi:hypothetical protein